MRSIPIPHEIYKHFKGNMYQIVTLAEHSESGELLIIYQALYGEFKTYARPLEQFMDKVDKEKYPKVQQEYRFERADMMRTPVEGDAAEPKKEAEDEELNLDPLVIEFLDADTYEERLNILADLHQRITDDMINVMAMATDIEVKPGDAEERYLEFRSCLLKLEKFECNRLR